MDGINIKDISLFDLRNQLGIVTQDAILFNDTISNNISFGIKNASKEQIIEALWQLVYADGRLDCYEDALMRQLGSLIGLSHRQLIEAKLRVTKD